MGRPRREDEILAAGLRDAPAGTTRLARRVCDDWSRTAPGNESLRQFRNRLASLASLRVEIASSFAARARTTSSRGRSALGRSGAAHPGPVQAPAPVAVMPAVPSVPRLPGALSLRHRDQQPNNQVEKGVFLAAYYNAEAQSAIQR